MQQNSNNNLKKRIISISKKHYLYWIQLDQILFVIQF